MATGTPPGAAAQEPLRLRASAWTLIRNAIGGPRAVAGKLQRIARTVGLYFNAAEIDRRLHRLEERGYLDRRPAKTQIFFGGLDMLRFVIEPAARDYYAQKGISFGFHQLLRILDDPVSMIDPTGFLSERDTIIGHLMQVTHLNPVYDLQILDMFPDGLEELERQVEAMIAGSHPRARTITAVCSTSCGATAQIRRRPRRCARSRPCAPTPISPPPSRPSRRCPGSLAIVIACPRAPVCCCGVSAR